MTELHQSISPSTEWKQQTSALSDMTKLPSDSFRQGWSPSKWTQSRFMNAWPHACGVIMGQRVRVIVSLSNVLLILFSTSLLVFICLYWFTSGELPSSSVSSLWSFSLWDGPKQPTPFKPNTCGALPTSSQLRLLSENGKILSIRDKHHQISHTRVK